MIIPLVSFLELDGISSSDGKTILRALRQGCVCGYSDMSLLIINAQGHKCVTEPIPNAYVTCHYICFVMTWPRWHHVCAQA